MSQPNAQEALDQLSALVGSPMRKAEDHKEPDGDEPSGARGQFAAAPAGAKGRMQGEPDGDETRRNMNGEGEDDDEGEDGKDYDSKFMRKHMRRYLKENRDEATKFMKDAGYMQKAVTDAIGNLDGIEEAEAVVIDGTEVFKAQSEFNAQMLKAFNTFSKRLSSIEDAVSFSNDIAKASGKVLVDAQSSIAGLSAQPMPRRGVSSAGQEAGTQMTKAQKLGPAGVKEILLNKAMAGDQEAGRALSHLETAGGNFRMLSPQINAKIESIVAGI